MFVAGQCVSFGSNSSISAEIHHNIGVQANMNSFSHFVLCVVLCLYTIAKLVICVEHDMYSQCKSKVLTTRSSLQS